MLGVEVSLAGGAGAGAGRVWGSFFMPTLALCPLGHPPWSDQGPEIPLSPALPDPLAADWFPGSDLSKSLPAPAR